MKTASRRVGDEVSARPWRTNVPNYARGCYGAQHTGLPAWPTGEDFADGGIEWFTTAELPKRLEP